jgi:hypothetical protein
VAADKQIPDCEQSGAAADAEAPLRRNDTEAASCDASSQRGIPGDDFCEQRQQGEGEAAEMRLWRWQRKLLDLSLHNRLLNYKPTRRSLKLFCPDPQTLIEKLEAGTRVRIVPTPQASASAQRDSSEARFEASAADASGRLATEALRRNEIIRPVLLSYIERREQIFRKVAPTRCFWFSDFCAGNAMTRVRGGLERR